MKALTNELSTNAYSTAFLESNQSLNNSTTIGDESNKVTLVFDRNNNHRHKSMLPLLIFAASTVFVYEMPYSSNMYSNSITTTSIAEVSCFSNNEKVELFKVFTNILIEKSVDLEPEFAEIINKNISRLLW